MISEITAREIRLLPMFVYSSQYLEREIAVKRSVGFVTYTQISLCLDGRGVFIDSNGTRHNVKKGDVMYFMHNCPNSYYPTKEPWSVKYLLIGGTALDQLMEGYGFMRSGVVSCSDNFEEINEVFERINSLNFEKRHAECSYELYRLLNLLENCIEHPSGKKVKILSGCIEYIKENYKEDISVVQLSAMAGVTPTYFGKLFKQVYKMSPQTYLKNTRIDRAQELLVTDKKMSLSKVAELTGFNSTSYFCNTFKKTTGITAEEFRRFNTYET